MIFKAVKVYTRHGSHLLTPPARGTSLTLNLSVHALPGTPFISLHDITYKFIIHEGNVVFYGVLEKLAGYWTRCSIWKAVVPGQQAIRNVKGFLDVKAVSLS